MTMNILAFILILLGLLVVCHADCPAIPGCDLCSNPDPTCAQCEVGKLLMFDTEGIPYCEACVDGCDVCNEDLTCGLCLPEYQLVNGACAECPAKCEQCQISADGIDATCLKCNDRYYKEDNLCKVCSNSHCAKCSRSKSCSTCDAGYHKNTFPASNSQLCVPCPVTCKQCTDVTVGSVAACTACTEGYYLTEASTCVACTSVDSHCGQCNSNQACDVGGCKEFFYNTDESTSCKACTPSDKCTSCGPSESGAISCLTCKDTYGAKAESDLTCDPCESANCAKCESDPTVCTACLAGFFMYKDDCVVARNNGCHGDCSWCVGSLATECTVCAAGNKGLDDDGTGDDDIADNGIGACVACDNDCVQCVTQYEDGCTACDPLSERPIGFGSSFGCATTLAVCAILNLDDPTKCARCFTDGIAGTGCGESCHTSCKSCRSTSIVECYTCPDGTDVSLGSCIECFDGQCKICTDTVEGACIECKAGYGPNNVNTCSKCSTGCTECSADSGNPGEVKCDTCDTGYFLKAGECLACTTNCASCTEIDGAMVCNAGGCREGYRRNTAQCAPCDENCDDCKYDAPSGAMYCTQCFDGYTLNVNNKCVGCPSYCSLCKYTETGVLCEPGKCTNDRWLTEDKKRCQTCPALTDVENCLVCTDANSRGESVCKQCKEGYFLNENSTQCLEEFVGCALSVDEALKCDKCLSTYNDTIDGQCFVHCLQCGDLEVGKSGDVCNKGEEDANYSEEMCFGYCWTQLLDVGGSLKAARGCSTDLCTNSFINTEFCEMVQDDKRCRSCCQADYCNILVLDGINGIKSGVSSVHCSPVLLTLFILLIPLVYYS